MCRLNVQQQPAENIVEFIFYVTWNFSVDTNCYVNFWWFLEEGVCVIYILEYTESDARIQGALCDTRVIIIIIILPFYTETVCGFFQLFHALYKDFFIMGHKIY